MNVGDRVQHQDWGCFGTVVGEKADGWVPVQFDQDDSPTYCPPRVLSYVIGENPKDRVGALKPDLSLVPPAGTIAVAQAMKNGADKYGAYNWRDKKVQVMTYLAAAQRHLLQFLDGEEEAEDSGVHHLAHAAACCYILLDAIATGNVVDNRPTPGAASRLIKEGTSSAEPTS